MILSGRTVVVTGGTSGIGRALAEHFHQRGNRVVIAGRRAALLAEVTAANPGMASLPLDLADAASVASFAERVRAEFPATDVLVNNAGISRTEDLTAGGDLATAREIVETNVFGVLASTAALLPLLRAQPRATILTTTSNLAFMPRSNYPTYCASKAFLHSWLQSLRHQLRATSIEVLELAPPFVQTELTGPEQRTNPHAMPLEAYIAEVMQILARDPTPAEILVDFGREVRDAERAGRYDELFAARNGR